MEEGAARTARERAGEEERDRESPDSAEGKPGGWAQRAGTDKWTEGKKRRRRGQGSQRQDDRRRTGRKGWQLTEGGSGQRQRRTHQQGQQSDVSP